MTDCLAMLHAGRVEISAQNHNYAVDPAHLDQDVEVTHINLNDGTCAGQLRMCQIAHTIGMSRLSALDSLFITCSPADLPQLRLACSQAEQIIACIASLI